MKIKKFWTTKDQDLAVKIIRQYPGVIFDDGTGIMLSLFICMSPEEYKKLMIKVGLWKVKDKKYKKKHGYPKDATVYTEERFYNPIIAQIIWWRALTLYGNPEEQKKAGDYLRKAGLECFILTSSGRKTVISKSKKASQTFDVNPFYQYMKDHYHLPRQIADIYQTTLEDLQTLYKTHKVKYQADRYRILIKYIEEKELLKNPYLGNQGEIRKLAQKWSTVHPPNPSNIAWHMTSYVFGISIRTLKTLYKKSAKKS